MSVEGQMNFSGPASGPPSIDVESRSQCSLDRLDRLPREKLPRLVRAHENEVDVIYARSSWSIRVCSRSKVGPEPVRSRSESSPKRFHRRPVRASGGRKVRRSVHFRLTAADRYHGRYQSGAKT